MKRPQTVGTLGLLTAFLVVPANLAAAVDLNGDPIIDACTGVAAIDHRVKIVWPFAGLDYGRAEDPDAGDKGYFALLEPGLVDGLWRYAMSGETAGDCSGAITAEVCAQLTQEAREILRPHCPGAPTQPGP